VGATQPGSRNLEFAAYGYGAAALLALLCIAIAATFGIFPGRGNAVVAFGVVAAGSGGLAAWRLWNDDAAFAAGALAYVCIFAVGLAAVIALLSPPALALIFNEICGDSSCRTQQALTQQQQNGYTLSGIAAAVGLGAALFGVWFLTVERRRRRHI
jgi:hypothetical protein